MAAEKNEFMPVDTDEVLDSVCKIPVMRWVTNGQPDGACGPSIADFNEAFDLDDDGCIRIVNYLGVLLASVQALAARVQELEEDVEMLHNEPEE